MAKRLTAWLGRTISQWLTKEYQHTAPPLCDFDRLRYEVRPCDVILVEGRSRVSEVIKTITQSPWSHSMLYIGRLHDIEEPDKRAFAEQHYRGDPGEQLVVEAVLGKGTVVTPLVEYQGANLRICRPKGIARDDAHKVIGYAIDHLGADYDVRQLLDLARFLFPYGVLPRRWRSSLFEHNAGIPTRTVCSSMLAAAFMHVKFPILPILHHNVDGTVRFYQRNPRRFTPHDFDHSPYFDVIKQPYVTLDTHAMYQTLPWNDDGLVCNDANDCFIPGERGRRARLKAPVAPVPSPAAAPLDPEPQPNTASALTKINVVKPLLSTKDG